MSFNKKDIKQLRHDAVERLFKNYSTICELKVSLHPNGIQVQCGGYKMAKALSESIFGKPLKDEIERIIVQAGNEIQELLDKDSHLSDSIDLIELEKQQKERPQNES